MSAKSRQLSTLVFSALLISSVMTALPMKAFAADKADDVFMDEGDGDFDSTPAPAKQTFPKADAAEKKDHARIVELNSPAPKKTDTPAPKEAAAPASKEQAVAPAPVVKETEPVANEVAPAAHSDDEQAMGPALTVPETELTEGAAPVKATEKMPETKHSSKHASKTAESDESHKTAHHSGKSKKEAGIYVVTNGPCPMTRKPASEEPMITVKPSKKIWVQEVDEKWVRGFNKAGEPGYISRDCVHTAE